MSLAAIGIALGIAYVWMLRGWLSSFLHLMCTIFAGAIAFAVWEPLGLLLASVTPSTGFFSFVEGLSWSAALLIPFGAALLALRAISDAVIKANLGQNTGVDYAGGAVCGLGSAIITVGIVTIGFGQARLATDFAGYQPLYHTENTQSGGGSLVRHDKMWLPMDVWVSDFYAKLSFGSFSTPQPLGKWHPNVELTGFGNRMSPSNGAGRNVFKPDDVAVSRWYTVGPESGAPVRDLLADRQDEIAQGYVDLNDQPVTSGYLAGFVVNFKPGAKESSGQVVVSPGQYRLLAQSTSDETETIDIYPVAVISQAEAGDNQLGRWRFDGPEVFINSVGGASEVSMAFEYVVPAGYRPLALYAKNIRTLVSEMPSETEYATVAARDGALGGGALLTGGEGGGPDLDTADALAVNAGNASQSNRISGEDWLAIGGRIGVTMNRQDARGSFRLSEDNYMMSGEGKFEPERTNNRGLERNLRVEELGTRNDQVVVQVLISGNSPASLLNPPMRLAPRNEPIRLIDARGTVYDAVGFVYRESNLVHIRYTPDDTLDGLSEAGAVLSSARDDQETILLFIVSRGVEIEHLAVGNKAMITFDPPFEATGR